MKEIIVVLVSILFILLIINHTNKTIEGLTNEEPSSTPDPSGSSSSGSVSSGSVSASYENYDANNNANILAQKNAANIQYLEERLQKINTLETSIQSLTNNVKLNTNNVNQLSKLIAQQAQKLTGVSTNAKSIPTLAQAGARKLPPPPPPLPQPS
jgi:hypothetical protein